MPILKPCPFCGSQQPTVELSCTTDPDPDYFVWCGMCKMAGPENLTEAAAVLSWNSRPAEETD